jgi:hypothetical protein
MHRTLTVCAAIAASALFSAAGAGRTTRALDRDLPPEADPGARLRRVIEREEAAARDAPRFPAGEELRYAARVYKGARWFGKDVGEAVFRVSRETLDGRPAVRIAAQASGGGFGYRLETRIESVLEEASGEPLRYTYVQHGSEERARRLEFAPDRTEYWKREHCGGKGCKDPAHRVGTYHCDLEDDECDRPAHEVWRKRSVHVGQGTAYDMLAAVYVARSLDIRPGFRDTLRVVETHSVYDVTVAVVGEETVETDAGTFQTYCVALEPKLVSTTQKKKRGEGGGKFRGLFGLSGSIRIWLDKRTKAPVRIRGTIPFGIDLNAEIDLVSRRLFG